MTCYEIFDVIINALNFFTIVIIAKYGYTIWRKQELLKEKQVLAKKILFNVYTIIDKLDYLRRTVIRVNLPDNYHLLEKEDPQEFEKQMNLASANGYEEQWNYIIEPLHNSKTLRIEAKLFFNEDLGQALDELEEIILTVRSAFFAVSHYYYALGKGNTPRLSNEEFNNYLHLTHKLWPNKENDQIDNKIELIKEKIENLIKPILKFNAE